MRKYIWLLPLICLVGGCVTASVTKLNPNKSYPKVHPDNVQVFLDEADINCDYEKVALIKTKAGYGLKEDKSVKKAREKASELGANGIILGSFEDPSTGAKVANAFLGTGASKKGEMLAIRVDNSQCSEDSNMNEQ